MSETNPERRRKIEDLPVSETELTSEQAENVQGGLLPYIEQDNLVRSTQTTDGTSNTILLNSNRLSGFS
jgi:hypothetical protein